MPDGAFGTTARKYLSTLQDRNAYKWLTIGCRAHKIVRNWIETFAPFFQTTTMKSSYFSNLSFRNPSTIYLGVS